MIPFRDANPSQRTPYVTITLIALNVMFFMWEVILGPYLERFFFYYAVIPAKFLIAREDPQIGLQSLFLPYVTSLFLHGGWVHLASNMWYLWIFGDNVEEDLGHFRFLAFYLLSGIAGGLAHTLFNMTSWLPAVGASGAIAGVLAAYMIRFPGARILTLVPLFWFWDVVELPALLVIGLWFLVQLLSGAASLAATTLTGGVAWWGHIGGFITGLWLINVLAPRRRHRTFYH